MTSPMSDTTTPAGPLRWPGTAPAPIGKASQAAPQVQLPGERQAAASSFLEPGARRNASSELAPDARAAVKPACALTLGNSSAR